MSITVSTDVFCDICRSKWIHGAISHKTETKHARKTARRAGWERRLINNEMIDVCPDCVKKHPRLKDIT